MSEKALSMFSTQEKQIEFLKEHAPEELLELYVKNNKFHDAAEYLQFHGRLEEAAYMFIRSINDENIIESLKCFLHLCRIHLLKGAIIDITYQNTKELDSLVSKAIVRNFINEIKSKSSQSLKETNQWKSLIEEFELYCAYSNRNLDRVHECIDFFKNCKEFVTEFCAVYAWLQIPQSHIQAEYWRNRLQYLLRLCEMTFPYIHIVTQPRNIMNVKKIYKDFEDIFTVIEVDDRQQKRKIFLKNPLVDLINTGDAPEIMNNWNICNVNDVHKAILQFLVEYISKTILKAGRDGSDIPDIGINICHKFASCQKPNCRFHHVTPTPSILYQRLKLACLQYTVMRQLDILYHRRLLKEEQSLQVLGLQRLWAERLVRIHIRYQSPHMSCPEVTNMVLDELPKQTRNGFINFAYKIWLLDIFKNAKDFEVMLKCIFVFQQLHYKWGINKFYWEMKNTKKLSHPDDLEIGFEYYNGNYSAIPVGNRLSLFFSYLHSNQVVSAITNAREFINYAIIKADRVMIKYDDFGNLIIGAFCDLVSLMEFTTSLIFANGSKNYNFYLPRAYLVNYFDTFTVKPLIPNHQYIHYRKEYPDELKKSFNQIEQLINQLINEEHIYLTIIIRLIRLLILIGLNESTIMPKVAKLFKDLNNRIYSNKIKNYLETNVINLKKFLHNDLKKTGCDSLVFVQYYQWRSTSTATKSEDGISKLTYSSIKGFRSALQQIISPVVAERKMQRAESNNQITGPMPISDDNDDDENNEHFDDQAWLKRIHNSSVANGAAKKIQSWFRRVYDQQKSHQLDRDSILDKVYNDVRDFCQNVSNWEAAIKQKGEKIVRKYHMFLRGLMVYIILELTKLQNKLDKIHSKLQKTISNRSTNEEVLEMCLGLKDDLKCNYNEDIESALESLSTTENLANHKEVSIEWLESRLEQANSTIDNVKEWINGLPNLN